MVAASSRTRTRVPRAYVTVPSVEQNRNPYARPVVPSRSSHRWTAYAPGLVTRGLVGDPQFLDGVAGVAGRRPVALEAHPVPLPHSSLQARSTISG
jgi:hypothetical protein